jgi:uncharacterized delta-60 repeat protein
MSLKRAGLTGRLNNQPRFTGRRITLNRVSLRRFPFPSAPAAPAAVYVEDVYSTYLYTGTGSTQSIPNNIRLGDGATSSGWIATLSIPSTTTSTYGEYVTVDSGGNVYVCGQLNTTVSTELFIAKYNSSGIFQWQKSIGGANNSSGSSVTVDNNNNVYVCGSTTQGSPATDDFLIAKYNSSGTLQWQVRLGNTTAAQTAEGIKTDDSGNIYVVGYTGSGAGGFDAQLAKYDTTGAIQWQRSLGLGGTAYNFGRDIAVDSSGNCYICGSLETLGSGYRMLVAKYNTSGELQWQRRLLESSTPTDDRAQGIAVDSSGNVYICGHSKNQLNTAYTDFIIAKYNTSGVLQWQRRFGATSQQSYGSSIAVDSGGNVYVNGYSSATPSGTNRMLIAKYDTSGVLQWQRSLGYSGINSDGRSIAVDNSGTVYVCGYGNYTIDGTNRYITVLAKLPGDGSGTGGYLSTGLFLTYGESSLTNTEATLSNSAATLNNTATTFSNTTSIATETTGNLTSSLVSITTGTGFGGLVWIKSRSGVTGHRLTDTTRGATKSLDSSSTAAEATESTGLTSFDSTGFTIGGDADYNDGVPHFYASWTFRKQAKFFDVVTYTGTGVARTISHNLGSVPGCIIVKRTSSSGNWRVYHRSLTSAAYSIVLNLTNPEGLTASVWNSTAPTSTEFSVGTDGDVNANGVTYVAYLFAHNAGGFGLTGTDNIISCGTYLGSNHRLKEVVQLGYEPQWVMIKNITNGAQRWVMVDNMRNMSVNERHRDAWLFADSTVVETSLTADQICATSTGFYFNGVESDVNEAGSTFIYMAIRRGPMKTPTSGVDVFQPVIYTGTNVDNRQVITNILTDMIMARQRNSTTVAGFVIGDRLSGEDYLLSGSSANRSTDADSLMTPITGYGNSFSAMNGFGVGNDATSQLNISTVVNNQIVEAFKRAPGFLDIVTYTGTGAARTISHNLGTTPEMMWIKNTSSAQSWSVYFSQLGPNGYIPIDTSGNAIRNSPTFWNGTSPNTTTFSVGTSARTNETGSRHVAYLMSSVLGVSKCSFYIGKGVGSTFQVDCGFTTGARFVLIKSINGSGSTGKWHVYDSARGIVSGNDPYLLFDDTVAEVTNTDYIDTYANGFEISSTAPDDLNDGYADSWRSQLDLMGTSGINTVAYGDNLWLAGAVNGDIIYSSNGYSWTTVSSILGGTTINQITYGNGLYVAVGESGKISTSANAITWSARTSGTSASLAACVYALGKYWIVGNSVVLSSTDGVTWSTVSLGISPPSTTFNNIKFLNNTLIIVGASGTIVTSTDGINFTSRTSGTSASLQSVAYGNNIYVVVGGTGVIRTSTNLVTWTSRNAGSLATEGLKDIVFASYRFVIVATLGNTGYSDDGITWVTGTTSAGNNGLNCVAFADDIILVGNTDGDIYTSDPKYLYWAIA